MNHSAHFPTSIPSRALIPGTCVALLLTPLAGAQTLAPWSPSNLNNVTNGDWTSTANWVGGNIANTSTEIADFRADWTGTAPTITLNANQTINGLFYDDRGSAGDVSLTLNAGNTLTLAGSNPFIVVDANAVTISGPLANTGGWSKLGAGTLTLLDNNTGLTGSTTIAGYPNSIALGSGGTAGGGTLALGSSTVATGALTNSSAISIVNGTLQLVNTTGNLDRIGNSTPVTLGLGGTLQLVHNTTTDTSETIGAINLDRGQGTLSVSSAASRVTTLTGASFNRGSSRATALLRGTSLSQAVATNVSRMMLVDGGASLSFVGAATLNNAPTGDTTKTVKIVPYLFGDSSATGNGNGFVTYDNGLGIRVLTTAQTTALTAGYTTPVTHENVSAPSVTLTNSAVTVNSLLFSTASATLNSSASTTLTVASGAVGSTVSATLGSGFSSLALGNGEGVFHTVGNTNTLTVNTPVNVTAGGGITKAGGGTLALTGNNLYTGSTVVNQGTLTLSGLSNTAGKLIINGGQVNFNTVSNISGGASALGNPGNATDGTIDLGGTLLFNGTTSQTTDRAINLTASADGRFSQINHGGTTGTSLTFTGNVTGTNSLLVRGNGGPITLSGVVSNTGDIAHTEAQTLFLTNPANSFTGDLNVFAGTVSVPTVSNSGVNSAIGAGSAISVGQITASGNNGNFQYTGTSASTNRPLYVYNQGSVEVTTAGEKLTLAGGIRLGLGSSVASPIITLSGAGNGEVSGNITGTALRVTKIGLGTWTLTGSANTYTGITTVTGGTLLVNGNITGSSSISVGTAATLGGTGSATGPVTINTGGFIAPGASIGTLSTGSATLASASTFSLEINTTSGTSDLLEITGNLSLGDADDTLLAISDLAALPISSGTYAFITYTGAWDGDLFTYGGNVIPDGGSLTVGVNQFNLDYDLGGNTVALIAVPEPGSAAMLFGSISLLALRRRRA